MKSNILNLLFVIFVFGCGSIDESSLPATKSLWSDSFTTISTVSAKKKKKKKDNSGIGGKTSMIFINIRDGHVHP